ncbi:MAG: hypothetical protein JXQ83_06145 [Candidatus Glassbacteria bacterium]|nr:hypothetical protein [Candidatus Glassbacteria bacterium]
MADKAYRDNGSARVLGALLEARRRIWRLLIEQTAVRVLIAGLVVCLALYAVEMNFYLPAWLRIAALLFSGLVLLLLAAVGVATTAARFAGLGKVARACDEKFPEFKNRLESAVELCRMSGAAEKNPLYSDELLRAAVAQAASLVSDRGFVRRMADFVCAGQGRRLRLERLLAAALAAVLAATALYDPAGFSGIFHKYANPLLILEQERSFRITVHPGSVAVLRGDSLQVRASGSIHRPQPMRIHFRQVGKASENIVMQTAPGRRLEYTFTFRGLENDLQYCIQQGDAFTDTFEVTVTSNPFVTELRLLYLYPAYTGLPPYETSRDRAIQALKGSRVVLTGKSSNVLRTGRLVLNGDSLRNMTLSAGRAFTDTITLVRDGSYRIRLEDCWGLTNSDTLAYPVTVIQDEYPRIALRFPEAEAQLDESMQQGLIFELSDDFGVSKVRLVYHKESATGTAAEEKSRNVAVYRSVQAYRVDQYLWDLKELSLLPQESVLYRLEAFDNDNVSGPKSTSTQEFRIRFPSLQEIFEREQQSQEEITRQLEELEDQGRRLQDEITRISDALKREQQMDWEQGQQLDQAIAGQQQVAQQLEELSDQLESSIRQLDRQEMLSTEVIRKLQQVHELMDQVATEELKRLMEQIQGAIDNLDQKTLSQAMEQFNFSQEKFMEKLDKTISLLEKLKLEQQMDYLVSLSSELAQQSAALLDSTAACLGEPLPSAQPDSAVSSAGVPADSTGHQAEQGEKPGEEKPASEPAAQDTAAGAAGQTVPGTEKEALSEPEADKLSGTAEELGEQTDELFEHISRTSEQMEQAGEKTLAEKLARESSQPAQDQLDRLWNEVGNNFKEGQLREAMAPQRRVSDEMRGLRDRLKEYSEQLKEKWKQQVAQAMESAFDDLAYLSARQEEIALEVAEEPDINHPDVLRYADRQLEVSEGLESVWKALLEAASDNFFISSRLLAYLQVSVERSGKAFEVLGAEKRNKQPAAESTKGTLASINAALLTLLNDSRMMQQSESGMGFDQMLNQLEQLAERQENLNQQMQGLSSMTTPGQDGDPLMSSKGGESPFPGDLMNLIRRMAAEQKAIRDQMAELAEKMSGRKDLPGSSLEGMVKEADEVVEDLLKRGVSRETLNRQRRILDRLLDAQRSIQQRDTGRKRKSETAGEYDILPPPALARELMERSAGDDELKIRLERWKGSYPESFERLIRAYYELLNAKKVENDLR